MSDTSSTHLIFFIAAMMIAGSVVSVVFLNVNSILNATQASSSTLSQQIKTDITIINDPENIPKIGNDYYFYVKNTGKSTLSTEYVNVVINGEYIQDNKINKEIIDGQNTTVWGITDVLQLRINYTSMPSGDNTIIVITENGVDDSLKFTIS